MAYYLGIDVGGTNIKYGVVDEGNSFISSSEIETPKDSLDSLIKTFIKIYESSDCKISGIGISFSATMDSQNEGYCFSGALDSYTKGVKLLPAVSKHFSVPVAIENDGNCAALGELEAGELQGIDNAIVVVLGTGVGGGIIIDKKLYRGRSSCAAEFSYIYTNAQEKEKWASYNGSAGLYQRLSEIKKASCKNGLEFFKFVENADKDACKILDDFTRYLSVQLYNLNCVLAPERVVISGGISRNPLFMESMSRSLKEFYEAGYSELKSPEIVRSNLGNKANIIGAIRYLKDACEL